MRSLFAKLTLLTTLVVLFVILQGLGATIALAQDTTSPAAAGPVTDDQVNAIAKNLYCPVCENITLDTCGTAACADWRYEIRLQLEAGKTEEEIRIDFVNRFGDRAVGTPMDPTLRAIAMLPFAAGALGLILAVLVVFRLTRRPGDGAAAAAGADISPMTDYASQLERDLAGDRS
ncbi:MAG: cytochrome c-type biogenesis protein CcmH [Chloroflexi bacterium]|nr:cytochrome c-type biogenesis protein CcmH [Chloroflexota bacterium]